MVYSKISILALGIAVALNCGGGGGGGPTGPADTDDPASTATLETDAQTRVQPMRKGSPQR